MGFIEPVISVIQMEGNGALTGVDAGPPATFELHYRHCSRMCVQDRNPDVPTREEKEADFYICNKTPIHHTETWSN